MRGPADCFHCGDALPAGEPIRAWLDGEERAMCCMGCKAVAEFIESSGLNTFYAFRARPDTDLELTPEPREWQHFDDADLLGRYVHAQAGSAEATVDIGGMYCSACVWLLDKAMQQIPAIESVDVNPAVRRAVIRWNIDDLPFSGVLQAIARVGFKPSPVGAGRGADAQAAQHRLALKRLIVAAAAGMQVMMFAVALYAGDYFGINEEIEQFLRVLSLLVTLPIISYPARPFFVAAWRGVRARVPGMDLPVSVAILAAFIASVVATFSGHGEIYFDSVAMFVFFLTATRFLEMRARHRSSDHALALAQLLPDTAMRVVDGKADRTALDSLVVGDTVSIRPGDVVPVDGEILSGSLDIDESMLTGESLPVHRQAGGLVYAGAVVHAGNAHVRVTQTGASTSLAEIGRMLESARADRPPIALLADRLAAGFIVAVLAIAAMAGLAWYSIDASRAFEVMLATLVVTCPCALALATPAALAAAASGLAKHGFLLVRSRILEVLCRSSLIVFDKTGTLTEGRPVLRETRMLASGCRAASARQIAAQLESASEHVLARAFAGFDVDGAPRPTRVQAIAGQGVEASIDGETYRIGKGSFVAELSDCELPPLDAEPDQTQVYLGSSRELIALFIVGDELRADARQAIAGLRRSGFTPLIASGDHDSAVRRVAGELGIEQWHAGLTPADKLRLLQQLQDQGRQVVLVGDGINDAPVLAAADGSIALDSGTALARASADAVSLSRNLGMVNTAVGVARRTQRIVRQNIAWAILYNATAIPLAVSGLLRPWMAALGMSASSLIVVFNALRLQRVTDPSK